MRLRLMGTAPECRALAARLPDLLAPAAEVVEVSGFYPNRRSDGDQGRVYVEIHLTTPTPPPSPSTTADGDERGRG